MTEYQDISPLTGYLASFLGTETPFWILALVGIFFSWFFLFGMPVYFIGYFTRKMGADLQARIGPNRVGFYGFLQNFSDALKFFFKEDSSSQGIIISISSLFLSFSFIPVAKDLAFSSIDAGLIWCLLGILFSKVVFFINTRNSKEPLIRLSGNRVLSVFSNYLVPIFLCVIPLIVATESTSVSEIVSLQGGYPWQWNLFLNPGLFISGILFYSSLLVLKGDPPFDHATADSEILSGIESGLASFRLDLFKFYSTASSYVICSVIVALYLGGWHTPFDLESFGRSSRLVEVLFFGLKVFFLIFFSTWIRQSLPRMSLEQIIGLTWKFIVPGSLISIFISLIWFGAYGRL